MEEGFSFLGAPQAPKFAASFVCAASRFVG